MVRDSFWTDSYIEKLSPDEKLVFIYLLTNPLCNIAGVYEIRSKRIGFETGYDIEVIENILKRFERDGKIIRFNDWLKLVNFVKNQSLNPSVEAGIARVLSELPTAVREAFGLVAVATDIKKRSTENFIAVRKAETSCRKCGGTETLQVDHIVPLFAGGNNDKTNLQVLCHHCHQIKTQEDFTAYQNVGRTACTTLLNSTLLNSTLPNLTKPNLADKPEPSLLFLEKLPVEVCTSLSEKYLISPKGIQSKATDLLLYCKQKGKIYKDYKAFLENALRKDKGILQTSFPLLIQRREEAEPELTPEQIERNRQLRQNITNMLKKK